MASSVTTGALPAPPTSRPYLALGLTFLLLGVGFASPVRLISHPPAHIWEGNISPQALNLYALTAFAGWSHFIYAWRGQWMGSRRLVGRSRMLYWASVLGLLAALVGLRAVLGVAVFSLAAWVYNIAHFIKAEIHFSGKYETRTAFYSPVAAFAWFTVCIFQVGPLANENLVVAGTILIGVAVLVFGGWRLLAEGEVRLPLLTLFLLGETMVWASYSPSEAFRIGVYIFHIAAAGFYHYLTAYAYAESSPARKSDILLSPPAILMLNAAVILAGCAVGWFQSLHCYSQYWESSGLHFGLRCILQPATLCRGGSGGSLRCDPSEITGFRALIVSKCGWHLSATIWRGTWSELCGQYRG